MQLLIQIFPFFLTLSKLTKYLRNPLWLLLVFFLTLSKISLATPVTHSDDADPTTQGWIINTDDVATNPGPGVPITSDADFPSIASWEISNSAGTRLRYEINDANNSSSIASVGVDWQLKATLRIVQPDQAINAGSLIEVANGERRYALSFGTGTTSASADLANTLINVVEGSFNGPAEIEVLPFAPGVTDYVTVTMRYSVATDSVVITYSGSDGNTQTYTPPTSYNGFADNAVAPRVNFGDGSSSTGKQQRFAAVEFQIDYDGDGLLDLIENDAGTDTSLPDSDNDFLGDLAELQITNTDLNIKQTFVDLFFVERNNNNIINFDLDAEAETLVSGSTLGSGTNFSTPISIVAEPAGSLLVTDLGLNALLRVDPSTGNRTIVSNSTTGTGDSFIDPVGIVLLNGQSALVADQGGTIDHIYHVNLSNGDRTVAFDYTGRTNENPNPLFMALENANTLLVAHQGSGSVIRFAINANGTLTEVDEPITGLTGLAGVAAQTNGQILVSVTGEVQLYTNDGNLISSVSVPTSSTLRDLIATYPGGALVANDTNESIDLIRLADNTVVNSFISSSALSFGFPEGIALRSILDTDTDGLGDYEEVARQLDPLDNDSDDDGLLDGFEFNNGFDPFNSGEANLDPDSDGLSNLQEQNLGTNPLNNDSDNDGLLDNVETNTGTFVDSNDTGTDPTNSDSDSDGLLDGVETNTGTFVDANDTGTNPNLADTDNDGFIDGVETNTGTFVDANDTGTNPHNNDTDNDGLLDGVETNTGTFVDANDTGTNPLNNDTDSDGLFDGVETNSGTFVDANDTGTNPLTDDTDNDGLLDGVETNSGTFIDTNDTGSSPLSNDTDGDGLLDNFEVSNGFNPVITGEQNNDDDNDGLNNLGEQTAGTNPNVADTDNDGFNDGAEVNLASNPLDINDNPVLRKLVEENLNVFAFGFRVATSGNTVAISSNEFNANNIYVFTRIGNSWQQQQIIPQIRVDSLAIHDDIIVAGDLAENSAFGAAFVYERDLGGTNNWGLRQTLLPSNAISTFDQYGTDVAIDNDTIIVGSPRAVSNEIGRAYIYQRDAGGVDNWGEVKEIESPNLVNDRSFGRIVDISGDTAVIPESLTSAERHRVFVFERDEGGTNNWGQSARLASNNLQPSDDNFGANIAIHNNTIIISNPTEFQSGTPSEVYIFERDINNINAWELQTILTSTITGIFGFNIGLNDNILVIADTDNSSLPTTSIYERNRNGENSWGLHTQITPNNVLLDDQFATNIAISDDNIIFSADGSDPTATNSGVAYIYSLTDDFDTDGLTNLFEQAYGFDLSVAGEATQDPDSDGLSNLQEQNLGTNPLNNDSDNDGLLDNVETNTGTFVDSNDTGTDPTNSDSDSDGLLDGVETNTGTFVDANDTGTNPNLADTDNDNLNDDQEIIAGSNPINPDTDSDTILDGLDNCPIDANLDQLNFDNDNEGGDVCDLDDDNDKLLDSFELAQSLDPFNPDENNNGIIDGLDDTDGDGLSNEAEQFFNSNFMSTDTDNDGLTDNIEVGTPNYNAQQVITTNAALIHDLFAKTSDLDGDGDLEIIEPCNWFENLDGIGTYSAANPLPISVCNNSLSALADFDNDGLIDILTASNFNNDTPMLFINNNNNSFTANELLNVNFNQAEILLSSDLNNDNLPDIIWSDMFSLRWGLNTGNNSFTESSISVAANNTSLSSADINGDSFIDLVTPQFLSFNLGWRENDGAGAFASNFQTIDNGTTIYIVTADIDNDTDMDVLANSGSEIRVLLNDGLGNFTPGSTLPALATFDPFENFEVVDIDLDGYLDIVFARDIAALAWFKNDGTGAFTEQPSITTDEIGNGLKFADLDNDFDLDFILTTNNGTTLTWYEQTPRTNLLDPDSDDDGLLDGVETNTGIYVDANNTGTDPTNDDSDGDGLLDSVENNSGVFNSAIDTGTDPNNPDSDNDGVNDGDEVNAGTDPNNPPSPNAVNVPLPLWFYFVLITVFIFTTRYFQKYSLKN